MPSRVSSTGKKGAQSGSGDSASDSGREAVKNRRDRSRREAGDRGEPRRRDTGERSEDRNSRRDRPRDDAEDGARRARRDANEELDRKSSRQSSRRRAEDDDSVEDGKLGHKKDDRRDERAKRKERDVRRSQSPRQPDKNTEERRKKDGEGKRDLEQSKDSDEEGRKGILAKMGQRGRDSSPRRRDGNQKERHHADDAEKDDSAEEGELLGKNTKERRQTDREGKKNRDKVKDSDDEDARRADHRSDKSREKNTDSDDGERRKRRQRDRDSSPHRRDRDQKERQLVQGTENDNSTEEGELPDKNTKERRHKDGEGKKTRDKLKDEDDEDGRRVDHRLNKSRDRHRNSDDEEGRKGDLAKRRQRDRDSNPQRRDRNQKDRQHVDASEEDNSTEEGELVDRKEERMKKRERERSSESPRRPDRVQAERRRKDGGGRKTRGKARNSDEEDERRRESSPRRRDRRQEERRRGDDDSGSPRRKEKYGDISGGRRVEQEKNRERDDVKDDSKEQPAVAVQQMLDAGVIKTGGIYIPPHRMAQMMREVQDKSSEQYQRLSWDALRKSINGLVNKVNATNIKNIIPELFSENLVRGRGLFCRSCMKSQMASPGFTDVFAALVAVVNTKFPEVGKLLLKRIVLQLQRAYKRNDKPQLLAATKFIAHLVNQQVAHEIVALELLTLLLEKPTDDSVEVAVGFVKECGALLQDFSPQGLHGIFERFRGILHEGEIDKRVQFLIEGLFAIRKAKFQGFPAIRPELDLVEQEDQFTHEVSLEDEIDPETILDVFRNNPRYLEDEKAYEDLKISILGEESSDEEESSNADADSDDEDGEDSEEEEEEQMKIKDETETNLVNLRRTIYLTIMSSVDFEEAGHKLLKIKLEPGQEMELCIMLLECCSQERTYLRYYGLLGQRFCMINKVYQENFEKCFVQQYSMIHRLETNKLRNVAKFFAHLLGTSALPWHVLAYIRLTEEDTTSSSRIFIKILFQELSEHLGIRLLNERLNDPTMQDSFDSIFPKDNPKNTRFSINFFTSIGLGGITESLREYLKNMPRLIMQQQKPVSESDEDSGSSASSSGSSSSETDSSSESESDSSSDESERSRRRNKKRRRN